MTTPAPDQDDESPPNPPPFITPPPTNTHSRIPQVTQSQTDDNSQSIVATLTPYEEDPDICIHYHDPTLVMQTPMQAQHHTSMPIAPIVYSPERKEINGIEEMAKSSNKKQKKRQAGRKQMEKMQKFQKIVVNHSAVNNLFNFIRNRFFDSTSLDSSNIKMSCFDTIVQCH